MIVTDPFFGQIRFLKVYSAIFNILPPQPVSLLSLPTASTTDELWSSHYTRQHHLHHRHTGRRTHLVRFTLAHTGAHSIHPQVGVQVVRAQTGVRVHHFGHRHGHRHRSHTAAVHIKEKSRIMSQKKPNPSGKQHPPHIRRVTVRTPTNLEESPNRYNWVSHQLKVLLFF